MIQGGERMSAPHVSRVCNYLWWIGIETGIIGGEWYKGARGYAPPMSIRHRDCNYLWWIGIESGIIGGEWYKGASGCPPPMSIRHRDCNYLWWMGICHGSQAFSTHILVAVRHIHKHWWLQSLSQVLYANVWVKIPIKFNTIDPRVYNCQEHRILNSSSKKFYLVAAILLCYNFCATIYLI